MTKLVLWWRMLVLIVVQVRERLRRAPPTAQPAEPPAKPPPDLVPLLAMDIPPPPHEQPAPLVRNRHARRAEAAWERERRKRDKFVTPKGPTPVKIPRRAPAASAVEPPPPEPNDGRILIDGEDGAVYMESEAYGEFTFRDTILDQLDLYFDYLRRMRRNDPDAYGLYCRVGATIVPPFTWGLHKDVAPKDDKPPPLRKLSAWWRQHRPGFGCVTYAVGTTVEQSEIKRKTYHPKFLYFTKYKHPPPEVQPMSGGDVYKMTIWWDEPRATKKRMKHGEASEYAVFISASGDDVHVLPVLNTEMVSIPEKKNGLAHFHVPKRAWSIPKGYEHWARKSGEQDANTMLSRLFIEAATVNERTNYSMVRVAVHKDDMTAVFGVEVKRIPYFFQDRDITLTESGVKRRIFHIVRPHQRKGGAKVPFHFRGLRDFTWADYRVSITVPLRDHFALHEFDVGSTDEYWAKPEDQLMTGAQVGGWLVDRMAKGSGASHRRRQ